MCRGTIVCMSRLDRITTDPAICHGQPTVRGLRYPVENLLELLASGMSIEEIAERIGQQHHMVIKEMYKCMLKLKQLMNGSR